jgi:hypothetical protein
MRSVDAYFEGVWLVRLLFSRGLAAIYLLAFINVLNQFRALLGENGLLPVPEFLKRVSFREAPSLFHLRYSDRLLTSCASLGIALSGAALFGVFDAGPPWLWAATWLVLWALYLSIVNVGQTFYGFGWESMLLEAGFFACFLGPAQVTAPVVPIFALRWMLFRTELGAGLIKLRNDPCWRDLTCLYYHYETQPLPNPLSWYFHRLPKLVHRAGVVFSHFVQVVAPFGLFCPQPVSAISGVLIIGHQLLLVVSGNYSWLNWLTIVLGFTAFSDGAILTVLPLELPPTTERSTLFDWVLYGLAIVTLALSVKPTLNFFARHQLMNYNYNALHLVSAYGAFGSVTRERIEVVLEGADDEAGEDWQEYGFRAKPGDPKRRPPQIAPYHLRLDWMMWFLPLGGGRERWFMRFVQALLEGDPQVKKLLGHDPFGDKAPHWIRARTYVYKFTDARERAQTGAWWARELLGEFLSPVALPERRTNG